MLNYGVLLLEHWFYEELRLLNFCSIKCKYGLLRQFLQVLAKGALKFFKNYSAKNYSAATMET